MIGSRLAVADIVTTIRQNDNSVTEAAEYLEVPSSTSRRRRVTTSTTRRRSTRGSSAPLLIVGRLVQGVAAALLIPSVLAVLTVTFEGERRSKAIATWYA